MSQTKPAPRPGRRHRPLLVIAALATIVGGFPDVTHPGFAPLPAPIQAKADPDELRTLLAGLGREPVRPDGHILRAAVRPDRVRLPVDPNARHPLSGPVAVRHSALLGSPGRPLRSVSLPSAPEPATKPDTQVAAVPEKAPAAKTTVKNLSSPAAPGVTPTPPVPQRPAPVARTAAAAPGHAVLVAGDSLSLFLADALRPMLAHRPGTTFASRGKVSSGLARPDFFDWEREMEKLAAANHPDTVVIMIATNDNQTLTRPDGKKVVFGRPGWEAEYTRRVRRLVELARLGNPAARIYWIGAPVMADARLNADVATINGVIARQLASLANCRFVDVSRTLADGAGRYTPDLPTPGGRRTARTRDGVHLTPYGAKLLANAALSSMSPTLAELGRP